jgi:signal transduction histidine kinase
MWVNNINRKNDLNLAATGLAHELKGPMSTIKACTEGLLHRLENQKIDQDIFKEYLKIINDEVNRCTFIVDNLLCGLNNGKKSEKQKINVHESLDQILKMLGLQGRCSNIKIVKNYDSRIPIIVGTGYELLQVFLSIIVNAIDAMEGEGTLTIETRAHMGTLFVSINNTGNPISVDNLENIFLPFYTTKAMQGGTGLGLYLARNFVNEVGGNIKVLSDEEDGTTFTITLPY